MKLINHKTTPRGKKITGSVRYPIPLSQDEFARTKTYADSENRSVANFMRRLYLIGLDRYEAENKKTTLPNGQAAQS